MKFLSKILIVGGFLCLIYGGWQIWSANSAQDEALGQAQSIVAAEEKQGDTQQVDEKKVPDNFQPGVGEVVGILQIPKLEEDLPIVEGTDEDELERGVGHYSGTAFSGQDDQIVLSGHRDTVFRRLGDLEIGDELVVQMSYGTYTYIIKETEIVDADDRTVIQPTAPEEVLTLTTCYPFHFIGNAPDRYIIYAMPK